MPRDFHPAETQLRNAITAYLETKSEWDVVTPELRAFLLERLMAFVTRGSTKFIAGCIEHKDSDFFGIDHIREIEMEVLDQWMFIGGERAKKRGDQVSRLDPLVDPPPIKKRIE